VQPLEGLDAAFLAMETGNAHLHVAAVLVLEPPEGRRSLFSPSTRFAQVRRLVEQRVHLVPQLRRRVVPVPLGLQRPAWVDDPEFEVDDHVRRVRLPEPGGMIELEELVADEVARPLDLGRPLWEIVVVEGLAGERLALVAKLHHAVLDGISGSSLLGAILDLDPRGRPVPFPGASWDPDPLPGVRSVLTHAASAAARSPEALLATFQRGVDTLLDVAGHNKRLAERGSVPPPAPFSAPRSSFNGALSSRRHYVTASVPLDRVRLVARTFGTTVNDVLLAGVAGALRERMEQSGEDPGRSLVALVPVSTRSRSPRRRIAEDVTGPGRGAAGSVDLGNRISGMLVSLSTDVDDPVDRLQAVAAATAVAKEQERLTGGRLLADVAQLMPPAVVSRLARWATAPVMGRRLRPVCNVVVSSLPGPRSALWCAGSRVSAVYPVGPVAAGVGLNVTCMTYQGVGYIGLLACRKLVPDLRELGTMLDNSLAELTKAAAELEGAAG
jgi:diacylglycerol O-acyltransferase / wax synthase